MTSGNTETSGNDVMTRRRASAVVPVARLSRASTPPPRWSRRRSVLGVFAGFAVVGFAAAYIGPVGVTVSGASAQERPPISLYTSTLGDAQRLVTADSATDEDVTIDLGREGYSVYVSPKPTPTPEPEPEPASESPGESEPSAPRWSPPFVTPDPGTAQAIAYEMLVARGWGDDQFACVVALWNKESGWRVNAYNAGSGAYGIPQSLPGSKMASAGADWETNPATQIAWGLGYIGGRYGTPCGAWDHSTRVGWY